LGPVFVWYDFPEDSSNRVSKKPEPGLPSPRVTVTPTQLPPVTSLPVVTSEAGSGCSCKGLGAAVSLLAGLSDSAPLLPGISALCPGGSFFLSASTLDAVTAALAQLNGRSGEVDPRVRI